MSADKRTVTTDALETLGNIITEKEGRDAIHLAVENVVAGMHLRPGEDIGILNGNAMLARLTDCVAVGIVDPFLKEPVQPGERFWLVVYPRQITSLRHVWTHPVLDVPAPQQELRATSEQWLRNFCATADCPGYETVMAAIQEKSIARDDDDDYRGARIDSEYLHFDGMDAHGEIPAEFWYHAEIVTGKTFVVRPNYFSCSC